MGEFVLPVGVLAASLVLNYFFCLRPMRRGQCGSRTGQAVTDVDLDAELDRARSELKRLGESPVVGTDTQLGQPRASMPSPNE